VGLDLQGAAGGVQRLLPAAHLPQHLGQAHPQALHPLGAFLQRHQPAKDGHQLLPAPALLVDVAQRLSALRFRASRSSAGRALHASSRAAS
jgi:hypothetical protein